MVPHGAAMIVGMEPTRVNAIRDALATSLSLLRIPEFKEFCKSLGNLRFPREKSLITSKRLILDRQAASAESHQP